MIAQTSDRGPSLVGHRRPGRAPSAGTRRWRWPRALSAALLALMVLVGPPTRGTSAASITLTKPAAAGDRVAEGDDFATTVLNNPWDLSEPDSFADIGPRTANFSNISVKNGVWSGTTGNDAQLFLLDPGYGPDVHWRTNDGTLNPIDTSKYYVITFRMYLSTAGPSAGGQFLWAADANLNYVASKFFKLYQGWHTYSIDLRSLGAFNGSWSGLVRALRFDPTNEPGVQVQIDWVRLTGAPSASSRYRVTWTTSGVDPAALVDIYCDADNNPSNGFSCDADRNPIGENIPVGAGAFDWDTSALAPGSSYFLHARASTDYAALKRGDPWDMSQASDVTLSQFANASFANGIFTGTTTGGDPSITLTGPAATPIDASRFKILTFRMSVARPGSNPWQNLPIVVIWQEGGAFRSQTLFASGPGMQTYTVNLGADPLWRGSIPVLRIDPSSEPNVLVQLDDVTLTTSGADPTVHAAYSAGAVSVNSAPRVEITAPGFTSGQDFAASVVGNAWDMSEAGDVDSASHAAITFVGGLLNGTSDSSGDPAVRLRTAGQVIDTTKFRYLTYRFKLDAPYNFADGWVSRWLWWNTGEGTDYCTLADVIVDPGWITYQIDLGQAPIDSPSACAGKPWGQGPQRALRFDPHEITRAVPFSLDYVKLTAAQEVDGSLDIQWKFTETDAGQSPAVNLFYAPAASPGSLSTIATGLPAGNGGVGHYGWNTAGLANGQYVVLAQISDGLNTTSRYSSTPFVVKHAAASPTPTPSGPNPSLPSRERSPGVTNPPPGTTPPDPAPRRAPQQVNTQPAPTAPTPAPLPGRR